MVETPSYDGFEPSSDEASETLSHVGSEDTEPERLLQTAVSELGIEIETQADDLPGRPDIVFREERLAVFCDGDFWHGRNWEERKAKLEQGSNPEYWVNKIRANRERDARHNETLRENGWTVLRFWEGDIKEDPVAAAEKVESALNS